MRTRKITTYTATSFQIADEIRSKSGEQKLTPSGYLGQLKFAFLVLALVNGSIFN